MLPCSLIAWDADGNVVGTLDYLVARAYPDGPGIGLHDFAAHETAGGKLREFWDVRGSVGSGTWPEWLGGQAHEFRVEVDPAHPQRIRRLVHRASGHVRERTDVEDAIARRIAGDGPADLRTIVGGPGKPLRLDEHGRTARG